MNKKDELSSFEGSVGDSGGSASSWSEGSAGSFQVPMGGEEKK